MPQLFRECSPIWCREYIIQGGAPFLSFNLGGGAAPNFVTRDIWGAQIFVTPQNG